MEALGHLECEITSTDGEIEELIHALYGITEQEKKNSEGDSNA
jgi:hypothetical protein